MSLSAGTKLGPYEIQSLLGAGGMGEVYRANDTRLDRRVAIKVLPSHLSSDPDRIQRFEREARTISSLNHPHICALYDVGTQSSVTFLVMEFLEGVTLAHRLMRGALSIKEVLQIGREIADALSKAHHLGIVHRDLKPGNIMLTKSGAKLMDFGLAKPAAPALGTSASAGGALTPETPTLSLPSLTSPAPPLTQKGHVLGTFQYMSPEQLQGCEADARSDIFAFGAVLYEMTTGRRAFEGKSQLSVITAILEKEPEPVSSLQKASPLALDHVIATCLAKNPDDRWQTAHDLKLQLEWVQAVGSQSGVSLPIVKQKRRMTALAWGLAAALAIGFALATVAYLRVSSKPTNTLVAFIPPPERTTFEFLGDTAGPPVISPDGHFLAFVGRTEDRNQLWLRALDSENAQALGNTEGAMFPFWSPDSRSIGFFANGKLKRIDINGGVLTSLCDAPLGRGGTWNKDGVIIFAPDFRTPLYRVSASGGEPVAVTKLDPPKYNTHRWPYFLPDGKHYLYLAANHESSTDPNTAIYLGSLDGKESRLVVHSLDNAAYSAGYLFFMRGEVLMAQRVDVDEGKLLSEPAAVASNVLNDINTWSAVFSVSEGMLTYQAAGHVGTQLTWLDRSGKQLGTLGDREAYDNIRISPQSDRVAVVLGAPEDIWIYDVSRGLKTRLTFNPERDAVPVWSPDGSHIIFTSGKSGHAALYYKAVNGTGSDELLLDSNSVDLADDWSLDGRFLLYERQTASSHADIWVLPLFGERKPFPLVQSPFDERLSGFSPDGRWVVYTSDESGSNQVYVVPFRGPGESGKTISEGGKWQISTAGGQVPIWRRDGKEILYQDFQGRIISAEVSIQSGVFRVGKVRPLFKLPPNTGFDATPDGQRFLIKALGEDYSAPITLLVNWKTKLIR